MAEGGKTTVDCLEESRIQVPSSLVSWFLVVEVPAGYLKLSRLVHLSRAALIAIFSITVSSDNRFVGTSCFHCPSKCMLRTSWETLRVTSVLSPVENGLALPNLSQ